MDGQEERYNEGGMRVAMNRCFALVGQRRHRKANPGFTASYISTCAILWGVAT